jgi:WD40 repeat protein/transcriptional regulator with XRE-family HTH domain
MTAHKNLRGGEMVQVAWACVVLGAGSVSAGCRSPGADRLCGSARAVAEQSGLSFAGLLRQLRAEARLTQEELAEAAGLSTGSVSNLERGVNRTAQKDTAALLAAALGLAGPAGELFVAAARGKARAADVLAAARGGTPRPVSVAGSPYRGLKAFEEQDAGFFFGREAATAEVLDRMSRLLGGAGLLVVSGVSGAGKSSLLRAGVLPQLRAAGLPAVPGAAYWPRVVLTPTRAPLDELALRAGVLAGADAAVVRRELEGAPAWFALTARQAALAGPPAAAGDADGGRAVARDQPGQRLVLVVDQFEELFTQCAEEGQRRAFITALHAAATAGHGPDQAPAALVVLGVRADFEARCADYPQLAGPVQDRYLVTAMTERQLRMAITEPAKKANAKVDDGLADLLLAEVRTGQPGAFGAGALPLLSHALDQAWRRRTGEAVTLADYERAGGIDGAVAASAQRVYDRLTPAQQTAAQQVFLRLTATSPDGADTADRATRAELTEGRGPAEAEDVATVLEVFAAERLLTLAADTVELSHEVLLTAWPLLRDSWLADTHADRIVRTRLHNTAADWERHARDPSYLYSGSLLQAAAQTTARISANPGRHPPLSQTETDFLHASGRAHRRAVRRRQAVIAGLLALTVIAGTAAGIAGRDAANASRQQTIALSRELAAESLATDSSDPMTARRLALAAWRIFPTAQARSVMTTLLAEQQQRGLLVGDPSIYGVNSVAFSPNGKLLAGADAHTVRLWNPATGQPVGPPLPADTPHGYGVYAVAFSPNGKLLAVAGRTVRLWNPATRQPVGAPLRANSGYGGVNGVAFSPNGKLLATAATDGTVRLWNPATGQPVGAPLIATTGTYYGVNAVAFSPNGKLLASAEADGTVRLWNPATGQPVGAPLHAGAGAALGQALGVTFSPDGKLLAAGDADGAARVWNTATRQPVGAPLRADTGPGGGVDDVAFSPDGKLLATADANATVQLWNPATGRPAGAPLQADAGTGGVNGVAFSPDGKLLAAGNGNGTVQLWNPATGRAPRAPLQAASGYGGVLGAGALAVAFSPDGKLLATAGADGTVRRWNPATGQLAGAPLQAAPGSGSALGAGALAVAFSPDGKLLATAGADGTVRLWNPATGRPAGAPLRTPVGNGGGVAGVAFSADGKLLAMVAADGTVQLWNPATWQPVGAELVPATSTSYRVNAVAFSPDGKLLATADTGGTVQLWNPATRRSAGALLRVSNGRGRVNGVAFSPDGKLLATADANGTVRLWNPATRQPAGALLRVSNGRSGVTGVAFSPDGKLLATAATDGTVRLWNPTTGQAVGAPLPASTGQSRGVNGVAFSPDGKLLAAASADNTVSTWQMPLFVNPYAALCADVGPPTKANWLQYAPGEPQPKVCG